MIKKVIRENLPETNSSSSHSVVISMDPEGVIGETEWDLIIDEDKNLHIPEFLSFGREFFLTNSAQTKLQYLSCYFIHGPLMNWGNMSKEINKFRLVLKDILGIRKVVVDELVDFKKDIKNGSLDASDIPYYEYPSVDSESYDIFEEILESEETIKNFILNKNTWLYGGSDGFRAAPSVYINTEILPKPAGCLSIELGGEIGRVDIELGEDCIEKERFDKEFSFLTNNFIYREGKWEIDVRAILFDIPGEYLCENGKLVYKEKEGLGEMKFELYDYGIFEI